MAAHASHHRIEDDRTQLGERAWPLYQGAWVAAIIGLIASVALGYFADPDHSFKRFLFAYLAAYGFFLSLVIGAFFFVLIQHLAKAGWSVNVRRVAEALGATMPVLAALSAPIIISVAMQNGTLYSWALPISAAEKQSVEAPTPEKIPTASTNAEERTAGKESGIATAVVEEQPVPGVLDKEVLVKRKYLNPGFFLVRMAIYLVSWSLIGVWFWKQSVRQDADGDVKRTLRMQSVAPIAAIVTFLTLTFGSVDLLMSLDPLWYSTIFGIYFLAGCVVAIFAFMSVSLHLLQSAGYLKGTVNVDHYHDLGKFLFAFVFFFGYIAFAQYMLLWYSNIPEETAWWRRHGGTTVSADVTIWSYVIIAILFGKILIPFGGLLSRHVKRNKSGLIFWSVWLLIFQALDIFWVVMPQLGKSFNILTLVIYLTAMLGIGGVMLAAFVRILGAHSLRPLRDPRLAESMAFTNIF